MKNISIQHLLFVVFFVLLFIFSNKLSAQTYISVNDLFMLCTKEYDDVYKLKDFLNDKDYYSEDLQGDYKDNYGDTISVIKMDDDKLFVSYDVSFNDKASTFFKAQLKDAAYYNGFSDDHESQIYTSQDGRFFFEVKKTATSWHFGVLEHRKNEFNPAHLESDGRFEINSYTSWADIYVKQGDKVYLKATGSISVGIWAGSTTPDGIQGFDIYSCNQAFRHGSLLGKIGKDGDWFLIGSYKSFTANASGKLYLMVNDCDPSNNSGYFYLEYGINKVISPN